MCLNFYIEKILNVNVTNYNNLKFYNNTIDLNIYTVFKIFISGRTHISYFIVVMYEFLNLKIAVFIFWYIR